MFHLVLFFFISGFLYHEEKYGTRPFHNIASRIQAVWLRYVFYASIIVLLHNWFNKIGVINTENYTFQDIIIGILNSFVFTTSEQMSGALWFVPVLIVSSGLFGGTVWLGTTLSINNKYRYVKYFTIIVLGLFLGGVGVLLALKDVSLNYHIQTSFLVIPFYTISYILNAKIENLDKFLKWYIAVPLFCILIYNVKIVGYRIDLSRNQIVGPIQFFVFSFIGIYFCLCLGKVIQYIPWVSKYFQFIGKYSFSIMALHFVTTKLIDISYAFVIGETDRAVYSRFVCAYSQKCWYLYAILGTILPAMFAMLVNLFLKKIKILFAKSITT